MVPALLAELLIILFTIGFGNSFARKFLFAGQTLIESRDTPYGTLSVTRTGEQTNVYENNTLLFSTDDQQSAEQTIHFVLSQHEYPVHVLLISGGITGLITEILKYTSINTIDYVEIDPLIFEIGKKFTSELESNRINRITGDPRIFLQNIKKKYDIVISFLPPPSSFYINRYYTSEFMMLVKNSMSRKGIFSYSLPLTANYLDEGTLEMYSSLYYTSRNIYKYVQIFPGVRCYFVASDQKLTFRISQILENKSISTDYVNFYYMDEPDMERRSKNITDQLVLYAGINTDFMPAAVFAFDKHWLNRFHLGVGLFRLSIAVILVLIFIVMILVSPAQGGMFAAGFSASSMQVVLILAFQIIFGYIFRILGLFAAVFMLGLAVGAMMYVRQRVQAPSRYRPIHLQMILAMFAIAIPGFIVLAQKISDMPIFLILLFLILILAISVTTGITFSKLSDNQDVRGMNTIRHIYGADLAGASMGALATSILFIPAVGIKMASCLAALLNAMVIFNMIFRQKKRRKRVKNNIFER